MSHRADTREPPALLTIDVDAEVARLATGQIDGGWQLPIELVRRAEGARARRIAVTLARGSMTVEDDGRPLPRRALDELALVADRHRTPAERHAAITSLEAAHPALLLLAGAWIQEATVESAGARLRLHRGSRASIEADGALTRPLTRIHVRGAFERRRAQDALRGACRFTQALVSLDRQAVPRGFEDVIATIPLRPPLTGRLALRSGGDGDGSRAWILSQGVVATQVTLAAAPPFEAAVSWGAGCATPASMRARLEPLIGELAHQAFELACEVARRGDSLPAPHQDRLARGLLAAARQQHRLGAIMSLPIIPGLQDGRSLRLSLDDLAQRDGRWPAVLPHEDPTGLLPSGRPILVVGTELRAILVDLCRIRCVPPPRRSQGPRASRILGPVVDGVRSAAASGMRSLRGRPLADSHLDPEERHLRHALLSALSEDAVDDVLVCEGRAAPRLAGRRLLLGRHHPDVVAAAARVALEPRWIYPALLVLTPRHAGAARRVRDAWLGPGDPAIVGPRR